MTNRDALKRCAAEAAAAAVEDGMVLGLGSGSTAELALHALAVRVAAGLRVSGVPTSERIAGLARQLGVPLTDFAAHTRLDLAIDGADEVEPVSLALIKGRGGALLREKIVAAASRRMLVVVDESKLVPRLGRGAVPVEIVAFGWQATLARLEAAGMHPVLRRAPDRAPFLTDGGNRSVGQIARIAQLAAVVFRPVLGRPHARSTSRTRRREPITTDSDNSVCSRMDTQVWRER